MALGSAQQSKYRITIRIGILSVFVSVFLVLAAFVLALISARFYENSRTLTTYVTNAISHTVVGQVSQRLQPAAQASQLAAELITSKTIDRDSIPQLTDYTRRLLLALPQAQMAYFGDEQGNFAIARRESDGTISTEIIDRRRAKPVRYKLFRDSKGEISRREVIQTFDYDPRQRPWYQQAKSELQLTWSKVYVFYSGNNSILGITAAMPAIIDGKLAGVFGIDVKLDRISLILSQLPVSKNGLTFIADDQRRVIAYPQRKNGMVDLDKVASPVAIRAFDAYKAVPQQSFSFVLNQQKYFAEVLPVPGFVKYSWRIYLIVPEQDITAPIWRANMQTLLYCALILLVGLILISFLAKRISKPINLLADDLQAVSNFNLDIGHPLDSRVREIHIMSSAIEQMKKGLRTFEKYMPRGLVQKLVASGEAARRGGRPRTVTMFFTDIDNFTAVSERIDDEKIMTQMCDYFDIMTKIIRSNLGTIDKYIGDSLMGFWNAPDDDPDHVRHACESALRCQEAIKKQNTLWEDEGKIPFPTRMGIHTGTVVIGNLGSTDRLNYTAIGDNVNVASRLEQLNKVYGTDIIISEDSHRFVSEDFVFRRLDKVVVKGRVTSHYIYELMAENDADNAAQLKQFCQIYEQAFARYVEGQWDDAMALFEQALELKQHDVACGVFIKRCEQFKERPPEGVWEGVWTYSSKSRQKEYSGKK